MPYQKSRVRILITSTLLLLLSIQLTGLTCLQDFQVFISPGSELASSEVISVTVPDSPANGETVPPLQNPPGHNCPCHMVTYLSGFTPASAPVSDTLAVPTGSTMDDNLSQSIFHPPLSLL